MSFLSEQYNTYFDKCYLFLQNQKSGTETYNTVHVIIQTKIEKEGYGGYTGHILKHKGNIQEILFINNKDEFAKFC